ncbi:hypothetical protein C1H46_028659 [Malus baccata]|uniref:Uncharacterized protein n=1 Tax=Malus baccata TaxID=106549 RepID=A0A540LGZ3_MALBA|nr:hypothetical protein C1H46_028659 [Malus baccata]
MNREQKEENREMNGEQKKMKMKRKRDEGKKGEGRRKIRKKTEGEGRRKFNLCYGTNESNVMQRRSCFQTLMLK